MAVVPTPNKYWTKRPKKLNFEQTKRPKKQKKGRIFHCACSGKMLLFTHRHTGSSSKMAIMSTPSFNNTMPEHVGFISSLRRSLTPSGLEPGPRGGHLSPPRRAFDPAIANVYFSDKPLKWVGFNHWGRWGRLNCTETIVSTAEPVTCIDGSRSDRGSIRTRTHGRFYDCGTSGESWLSSPDFVTSLCGISIKLHTNILVFFVCF